LTIIYGAFDEKTPVSINLFNNPRSNEGNHKMKENRDFTYTYGYGDGIVTTDGSLLAGIKWAHEFD